MKKRPKTKKALVKEKPKLKPLRATLFAIFLLVATWLGYFLTFMDGYNIVAGWLESDHKKFIKEKYITDIIAPINANYPLTKINYGNGSMIFNPIEGWDFKTSIGCWNDDGFDVAVSRRIKILNSKILLSIVVEDLITGEIILELIDNKVIINKTVHDYHSDSRSLEILDNYGYVAFQLWINNNNEIEMRGYDYGRECTWFSSGNYVEQTDPFYSIKVRKFAEQLRPMFLRKVLP